ncbi:MAG: DUF4360 domain-containing protein [Micropepsaceae bacterium]
MRRSAAFFALMILATFAAQARNHNKVKVSEDACQSGTYSTVSVSESGTLSILFDTFSITRSSGTEKTVERRSCNIQVSLNLPQGYSLGVYEVDYRGFTHLSDKQQAELNVDYSVGRRNAGRGFRRRIRGAYEGEFLFSEPLRPGLLKRIGCGEDAVLNIAATLELKAGKQTPDAMVVLDSIDGTVPSGLVYRFDIRKCEM